MIEQQLVVDFDQILFVQSKEDEPNDTKIQQLD